MLLSKHPFAAAHLRGCGDGKIADKAATEAMRSVLNQEPVHTRVVIGEGERDDAPMLFIGEELGDTTSDMKIDIAVDPLECTNHCARFARCDFSPCCSPQRFINGSTRYLYEQALWK
ncbi:MAG: hypothetical protein CM1200mP1_00540 [Candidatus Neomarinimicrobiota bacterium]|nr:MAG: hypothetical protein CM1200mP1_00540 [Candidatus Neomarinimicrobiota bacterium]